jgi:hypothetical protein
VNPRLRQGRSPFIEGRHRQAPASSDGLARLLAVELLEQMPLALDLAPAFPVRHAWFLKPAKKGT